MENRTGIQASPDNNTSNIRQVSEGLRQKELVVFEPILVKVLDYLNDSNPGLTPEEVTNFLYEVFKPIRKAVPNLPEALALRQIEQQLGSRDVRQFLTDQEDVQTNTQSDQQDQVISSSLGHSPAQEDGGPVMGWRPLAADVKNPESPAIDQPKAETPAGQGPVSGWKGTLEGVEAPQPKKIT